MTVAIDMPTETGEGATPAIPQLDRPITPSVFLTLGTKVLVLALSVAGTVLVARALGPSGRGAIAVALSFALLLVQLGSLGLQTANPYFAAREPRYVGKIVLNTLWAAAAIGAVLVFVMFVVKARFPGALRGLDWLDVIVAAAALPALLAMQLLQSVFLAEGRMREYNGIELAGSVAGFIGLTVGLTVLHVGVLGALVVLVGSNWGMAVAFLVLQRHQISHFEGPDVELFWRMLKYGFRIYVTTCVAFCIGRINLLLVNFDLGSTQAGLYVVGVAIGESLHLLPTIVPLILLPRIARGATFERSAGVFRVLSVMFGGLCLLTVPLAGPVIHLLYGSRFVGAAEIYYWMLPGIFCYGMTNVLSYHFAGRGFPLEAMLVWVPGLVIDVSIVAIFVPGHGSMWLLASSIACLVGPVFDADCSEGVRRLSGRAATATRAQGFGANCLTACGRALPIVESSYQRWLHTESHFKRYMSQTHARIKRF